MNELDEDKLLSARNRCVPLPTNPFIEPDNAEMTAGNICAVLSFLRHSEYYKAEIAGGPSVPCDEAQGFVALTYVLSGLSDAVTYLSYLEDKPAGSPRYFLEMRGK